jgi:hypothetical protein
MSKLLSILMPMLLLLSCTEDKSNDAETMIAATRAEEIGFNPNKCMCCRGWIIRIGNDTIKTTDIRVQEIAGLNITLPVPVIIEWGELDIQCPDFYSIKSIVKAR